MVSPANTYRRPDEGRPRHRGRRAGQVLPDGHAELRARRRLGRQPGPDRRRVHEGRPRRHEGLHPGRQGAVREGRRRRVRVVGEGDRSRGRRPRGLGQGAQNYKRPDDEDQGHAAPTASTSAASRPTTAASSIKDKVAVVGDNEAVKLLVSDGFVLSSLFEEAGADNVEGAYGTAPTLTAGRADRCGRGVRRGVHGGRGRRAARGLHGLRRRGGPGAPRRDQPLGRHARGRHREAVRDGPPRRQSSGRCRSTRTATRRAASSPSTRPRAARGPSSRRRATTSNRDYERGGRTGRPLSFRTWRPPTPQPAPDRLARRRPPTAGPRCGWSSALLLVSASATG